MNQKNFQIHIKRDFPNTHFFVYKKKNFPFNFDLFKLTSQVFCDQAEVNCKYIQLLSNKEEESIEISDDAIESFIQYVQRGTISIENENVLSLNFLGHKYQIDELIESTKEYITKNQADLVLDILSREDNQNINLKDMSTYEEIVSEHFLHYINDNRMLNLQIPTIYRILCQYQQNKQNHNDDQNQHKNESDENDQIFNFLTKCLDKFGKQASVLFSELNSDETKSQYLNVLLNKYSKSFDFHFLNSNLTKMKYERENELFLETEKKYNETINELSLEISKLKKNQEDQANLIGEMKIKIENYETEKAKNVDLSRQMESLREELALLKKEIEDNKNTVNQTKIEINEMKKTTSEVKNIQTINYDNNKSNQFNGIFTRLGQGNAMDSFTNGSVSFDASSIWSTADHLQPKNVLNYNDNKQVFQSKKIPESWLRITFNHHKVNPSFYSIRSTNYGGEGHYNLQNWDIEGSNDNENWDPLDKRRNEMSLDENSASNTFEITTNKQNYYRYLRLIQRGKNTHNDDRIFFSSIEFFGNIETL